MSSSFAIFCHSLESDWNHGNAHFLRGLTAELLALGHRVRVYEPAHGWSRVNMLATEGAGAIDGFRAAYPGLSSTRYDPATLDLDAVLDGVDVVLVHEWNAPELVNKIGQHRARTGGYVLLFHDTHHRMITAPFEMAAFELEPYDGVLAFGEVLRQRYLESGRVAQAWTWHEAADTSTFFPRACSGPPDGDLVWIGNWGDGERAAELHDYLLTPVRTCGLRARVYGVRYPAEALAALADAAIEYGGWLPNYRVPEVFARHRATVHVPRRPYVEALPGIPTIRVFEALASGIPLVSNWWDDAEGLFRPGSDYLVVRSSAEMVDALRAVTSDVELARSLAASGRETILARHTCAHRASELLAIVSAIQGTPFEQAVSV